MKRIRILTISSVVLVIMAWIGYYNLTPSSVITLDDIEALSDGECDCSWYLHHFNCELYVGADARLYAVIKLLGLSVKSDGKVDLTCMTQFFNQESGADGEGPCEKGEQVTCNSVCSSILNSVIK